MLAKAIRPTPAPLCIDDIIGGGVVLLCGEKKSLVVTRAADENLISALPGMKTHVRCNWLSSKYQMPI